MRIFNPVANGSYPVIVFMPGLDGIAAGFVYQDFCTKLAQETNKIIVVFNKIAAIHLIVKEETFFEMTFNWTLNNLNDLFQSKSAPQQIRSIVRPNIDNGVSLLSHSSGGRVVSAYLEKNCGPVNSLVMLDPVDGMDPFGITKSKDNLRITF